MAANMLEVRGMSVTLGGLKIVDELSFTLCEGQWLMLVGPNGAGKSTIVGAVSQGVAYEGSAYFVGRDLSKIRPRERAGCLGVLSQGHSVGYSFTAEEVVRLGRYSYSQGFLSGADDGGEEAITKALEATGLLPHRTQSVLTLSGGELQRTFLAQLFAQNPKLLILDEPANHLDLAYQRQVFGLIRDWLSEGGRAVISVVHDLSLAKSYGTHALLLSKGKLVSSGAAEEVLTRENLERVYEIDVYAWMSEMLSQWND